MEFLTYNSPLGNTIANTHSKILFAHSCTWIISHYNFSLLEVQFVHLKISSGK